MKKKVLSIVLTAAMMANVLAGCSTSPTGSSGSDSGAAGTDSAAEGSTIKIGVFEPKTGENGSGGTQEELGIEYANSVRPTVTVGGTEYTIELDWQDNQSDKTVAATAAQKLISDGCVGVIGGYGSGTCIAAGSYFADAKIPAIGTTCTNTNVTLGNDYYFRVCYLDPFQGTVMADWAIDQGYTEIATIDNIGNEYTSGLVQTFTAEYEAKGGKIVAAETFQTNESDFKAILTNIKASGVKAVFAPTDYLYAPLLLNQAADLGLDVQWIAGDTWNNPVITEDAGDNAEGVVIDCFYAEGGNEEFDAGFKEWINADSSRLEANLNSDTIIGNQAMCYDAYMVMLDAIEAADSLEGEAIQAALKDINVTEGVVGGAVKFDENGDAEKNTTFILKVEGGEFTYVDSVTHEE
ncbi:MAG: ABC transporter substrate-binding protein [Lachnospiraceae bacterium]|nr:ABC transporter substrate-binding protein [Lachnospiraceae bacterium]